MELTGPPSALAALAGLVLGLLRRSEPAATPAVVVTGAPAPFAANGYARARLLRQLHASGPRSDCEII